MKTMKFKNATNEKISIKQEMLQMNKNNQILKMLQK